MSTDGDDSDPSRLKKHKASRHDDHVDLPRLKKHKTTHHAVDPDLQDTATVDGATPGALLLRNPSDVLSQPFERPSEDALTLSPRVPEDVHVCLPKDADPQRPEGFAFVEATSQVNWFTTARASKPDCPTFFGRVALNDPTALEALAGSLVEHGHKLGAPMARIMVVYEKEVDSALFDTAIFVDIFTSSESQSTVQSLSSVESPEPGYGQPVVESFEPESRSAF